MLFNRENFYLLLEGRSIEIDESEFINIAKECTDWFISDTEIYRGLSDTKSNFLLVDPKEHIRNYADNWSWHNIIIDDSTEWSGYPKRNQSIICTPDIKISNGYGKPHLVIPFNNANIAVCPKRDMWISFDNLFELNSFNHTLYLLISQTLDNLKSSKVDISSMRTLNDKIIIKTYKDIEILSKFIDDNYTDFISYFIINFDNFEKIKPSNKKIFSEIIKQLNTKSLLEILNEIFSPKNFYHVDYKDLHITGEDNEVWTDSKCLLVNYNLIQNKNSSFYKEIWSKKYNDNGNTK